MLLVAILDQDVFSHALSHAADIGRGASLPAGLLRAPLDDDEKIHLERVWDSVQGALQRAYREGIEAAQPLVHRVSEQFAELVAKFKERAEDIRAAISARLNDFLRGAIEGALARIQPTIKIGGREIAMSGVTIEQKIKMSGSLKSSLEEICAFVAEGELKLSAKYGSAD